MVTVETKGFNQRGEEVCYFRRKVMVWKRDAAPVRQRPYERRLGSSAENVAAPHHPAAGEGLRSGAPGLRARPGRPTRPRPIARLVEVARLGSRALAVVDVAAGTGKLTRLLLTTGATVVAVEPVAAMRASVLHAALPDVDGARRHRRGSSRWPTAAVDAVAVAAGVPLVRRAGRAGGDRTASCEPGGALAVRLERARHAVDPGWPRFDAVLVPTACRRGTYEPNAAASGAAAVAETFATFAALERLTFPNPQRLTPAEFVAPGAVDQLLSAPSPTTHVRPACSDEVADAGLQPTPTPPAATQLTLPHTHESSLVPPGLTPAGRCWSGRRRPGATCPGGAHA